MLDTGSTKIYQPKTNAYRELLITERNKKLMRKSINILPEVFRTQNVSLLTDIKGKKLDDKHVIKTINKILKPFGDKYKCNLKSHSFRIGLVTALFQRKVTSTIIQEIMGHKSLATTLSYNRYQSTQTEKLQALSKIS